MADIQTASVIQVKEMADIQTASVIQVIRDG